MGFWQSVLSGLTANLAFALLLPAAWFLFLQATRRRLLRFFGLTRSRRIHVYLSQLNVPQNTALDSSGTTRSFSGLTLTFNEIGAIQTFTRLFHIHMRGTEAITRFVRRILLDDVEVEWLPALKVPTHFDLRHSLITLGSPGYNDVSRWVQETASVPARFVRDNTEIEFDGRRYHVEQTHSPALVLRARVGTPGTRAFYAAGLNQIGTTAAYKYLAENWKLLASQFGSDHDFAILIRVDHDRHSVAQVATWQQES